MATITIPRSFGGTLIIPFLTSGGGGGTTLANVTPNLSLYVRPAAIGIGSTTVSTTTIDYSPIYVGDTGALLAPQFVHKTLGTAFDLTSSPTFTARMTNQYGTTKTLNGTWTVFNAAQGIAYYILQATDVDTAGAWTLQVSVSMSGETVHADPVLIFILATV